MTTTYQNVTEHDLIGRLRDGARISGVQLCDAVLPRITAYDLNLEDCIFDAVDFGGADLSGMTCSSVKFKGCDFQDAVLEDTSFENCSFYDPEKSPVEKNAVPIYPPGGCLFIRADLQGASFRNCDLSLCVFENANVFRISMQDCKATATKFRRAAFKGSAKLLHNVMKYADLQGAQLAQCDCSYNDLEWANLDEVDFTGAILLGCNLNGTTIRHTRFEKADLRGAVLASFDLRTTDLHGVKIYESQMRQLVENCGLAVYPDNPQ